MVPQQPRRLAVSILNRIDTSGAFAEPLIDRCLSRWRDGDPRDRALVTELVYGTLRMRGFLDWVLAQFLRKNLAPAEASLRNILRTALYQLFFTERIPPRAAVHEAVALARAACPGREALVNAILRGVLRRRDRLPYPDRREDFPGYVSVLHSHPPWLVERWLRQWDQEETLALCRANNTIPETILRVNRLQTSGEKVIETLAGEGVVAEKTRYAPEGLVVRSADRLLRDTISYLRGDFQIQDEASQFIARLVHPVAGETILDLCAGIGGKATHLAELMDNRGRIIAVELLANKFKQLHVLAARLGIGVISTVAADATRPLMEVPPGSCDRVLLDVPCSGLGTLRRCPEIKWRLAPGWLARHATLQKRLLARAGDYVKPGGRLVYSTCSIMAEENEDVVRHFLEQRRDFHPIPAETPAPELLDGDGYLRTFPHRHGTDGFFGAVLEKETRTG
jgi:16S rRNA (cytosine967-C5)-methyltransferase